MNNMVLDVAIGLVFIYTLYSLLATTISELLAIVFAYRGRMLERGLEQMLDGENYSVYWWDKVFIASKVIAGGRSGGKAGTSVNKTYLGAAREKCDDAADNTFDNTKFCQKTKLFAALVTAHPLYRRASENTTFSKKPAYLSPVVFTDIFLDLLKEKQESGPLLLKNISVFTQKAKADHTHPMNADLAGIIEIFLRQANGDMQKFRSLVQEWYQESMDRVSGWYKKQTFRILLLIGFFLAVIFNVSTIGIVRKLSVDKNLREAALKSATEYVKKNQDILGGAPDSNTVQQKGKADLAGLKDGVRNILDVYQGSIEAENVSLGLGYGDFGYTAALSAWNKQKAIRGKISMLDSRIKTLNSALKNTDARKGVQSKPADRQRRMEITSELLKIRKLRSGLQHTLTGSSEEKPVQDFWRKAEFIFSAENILGFIITAFAISLGSPFWFDLLNRFINLRAAGVKPENTVPGPAGKPAPSPKSFA